MPDPVVMDFHFVARTLLFRPPVFCGKQAAA
jgi:hypothetical protein